MPRKPTPKTQKQLLAENADLRARLEVAEETLRAIRNSEVDAFIVPGEGGNQLFTLKGADRSYRVLIEEMNEGALTLTAEGVILYANRSFAEMLKTPLEKVIGSTIHTWIAPDSKPLLQSLLRKGVDQKSREQFVLIARDGTRVPISLSVSQLLINERPASFCLVATDLTGQKRSEAIAASETLTRELLAASNQSRLALLSVIEDQKRIEEALTASEAELRTLFKAMTDVVIVYDADGRYLKIAPTNLTNFYRPLDDMLGKTVHDILPKEQADYIVAKIGEAIQTGRVVAGEYALQIDGKKLWFASNASRLSENTVTWVANDITERKQAEIEIRRHAENLTALYESSMQFAGKTSLDALLKDITKSLLHLFDATGVGMYLYDPATTMLEVKLATHPSIPIGTRLSVGEGLAGKVAQTRRSMRIDDYAVWEGRSPKYEGIPVRATLETPLIYQDRLIGVLVIHEIGDSERKFTEADERLLSLFTAQAAAAIENVRLFEEINQRLNELKLLYESGLALGQLLNPKEIGQKIIELLMQKLDWHHTTIRTYHPQDETLELLAFNQSGGKGEMERRETEERFQTLISRPGQGMSGWVVQNDQVVRSGEVGDDPRYIETEAGIHSGLYVPMKSGQRMIGVISIESELPNAFSETDERLVTTLAAQAASALENARLFEETRQHLMQLETINRISIALRAISEQDEMLAVVLEETLNALNASNGSISLLNNATGKLHRIIARGWPSEFSESPIQPGEGIFGSVFVSGNTYISRDFASDPLTLPEMRGQLPAGWGGACVPIRSTEKTLGVMLIAIPGERELGREQVRLLDTLAEMIGISLQRSSLYEQTIQRLSHLESLRMVDRAIAAGSLDQRITLNILIDQVIAQPGVDAADVLLLNTSLQTLQFSAGQGFHTDMNKSASVRVGDSFAGRAVLERTRVRVEADETVSGNRSFLAFWQNEGFSNYYAIPLITKGQVKGVMEVFSRSPFTPDPEWLNFMETLAGQASIAIDNAQLFEHLQGANQELTQAYEATIEGWSRAMDLRDKETEGHTQRVTTMATDLAQAFGLNDQETLHIRHGALLHDMGKMGVPDHILLKPGKLVDVEWAHMQQHPQFAYDMLQPIHYLRDSLDIPYCHHEKWDGTGYPRKLKGEEIPLAARIFAIVDVYDALTSDRPYRSAWPKAKALKYILEQSGTHFDPQVVEKFLELPEK